MAEKQLTEARVKELIAAVLEQSAKSFQTIVDNAIKAAVQGMASAEDVQKLVDNLNNFVTKDAMGLITADLITKDQWNEALEGILSPAVTLSGIHPGLAVNEVQASPIPAEFLSGLMFKSARFKKTDAGKSTVPTERPLTPSDVLSWTDNGDSVSFVTADGKKYNVDKE